MADLVPKRLQGEQAEHHLPEGGNSFHAAEQAKQILPKFWSSQGSRGHGALWTFHWLHQRCDSDNQQMKTTLLTQQ